MRRQAIYDAIPGSAAAPLTVASACIATVGAGLVLMATAYGDWIPALLAGIAFAVAGVVWHAADHAGHRGDR